MCVVVDRDVFNINKIVKIQPKRLFSKGRKLCPKILMGEMAKWFYVGVGVHEISLYF